MQKHRALSRSKVTLVGVALAVLTFAPTAAARQDEANLLHEKAYSPLGCPLERIGVQFVRCDNLTGAGVPAPSYVPEAP